MVRLPKQASAPTFLSPRLTAGSSAKIVAGDNRVDPLIDVFKGVPNLSIVQLISKSVCRPDYLAALICRSARRSDYLRHHASNTGASAFPVPTIYRPVCVVALGCSPTHCVPGRGAWWISTMLGCRFRASFRRRFVGHHSVGGVGAFRKSTLRHQERSDRGWHAGGGTDQPACLGRRPNSVCATAVIVWRVTP